MANVPDFIAEEAVPGKLMPKLGRIAVYFVALDDELNRAIWYLLRLPPKLGHPVTAAILNFSTRAALFRDLAHATHHDPHHQRITDIHDHMRLVADDRNRVMHDRVLKGDDKDLYFVTTRGGAKGTFHVFDKAVMDDMALRLRVYIRFLRLLRHGYDDWQTAPLPSLDKSPTLLLRKSNETPRKEGKQKRRPKSSRP